MIQHTECLTGIRRQLPDIEGKTEEENDTEECLKNSHTAITFHATHRKYMVDNVIMVLTG